MTFHGYWPEKGGLCPTGSFKDMEAVPTIQRMHDHNCRGSFVPAQVIRLEPSHFAVGRHTAYRRGRKRPRKTDLGASRKPRQRSVVVVEDGDYYDAKTVAKGIAAQLPGWQMEGSVHNVHGATALAASCLMLLYHWAFPTITSRASAAGRAPWHSRDGGPLIEAGLFEGPAPANMCLKAWNIIQFTTRGRLAATTSLPRIFLPKKLKCIRTTCSTKARLTDKSVPFTTSSRL